MTLVRGDRPGFGGESQAATSHFACGTFGPKPCRNSTTGFVGFCVAGRGVVTSVDSSLTAAPCVRVAIYSEEPKPGTDWNSFPLYPRQDDIETTLPAHVLEIKDRMSEQSKEEPKAEGEAPTSDVESDGQAIIIDWRRCGKRCKVIRIKRVNVIHRSKEQPRSISSSRSHKFYFCLLGKRNIVMSTTTT